MNWGQAFDKITMRTLSRSQLECPIYGSNGNMHKNSMPHGLVEH